MIILFIIPCTVYFITGLFDIKTHCDIRDSIRDQEKEHYPDLGEVKQPSHVREVATLRNMGHYVACSLGFDS